MIVNKDAEVNNAANQIKEHISGLDRKSSFAIDTYIEADHSNTTGEDLCKPDDMGKGTIGSHDAINPFDKYTKGDYLFHNQNKKYKDGTYIRNDKQAKEYRALAYQIKKLFPDIDLAANNSVNSTTSYALQ
jgi:hypothetical protein